MDFGLWSYVLISAPKWESQVLTSHQERTKGIPRATGQRIHVHVDSSIEGVESDKHSENEHYKIIQKRKYFIRKPEICELR